MDEANGHTAVAHNGDDATDSAEGARTGHVHAAAKEAIVNQWLQGSLDNVSPTGQLVASPSAAMHSKCSTLHSLPLYTAPFVHQLCQHCQLAMFVCKLTS